MRKWILLLCMAVLITCDSYPPDVGVDEFLVEINGGPVEYSPSVPAGDCAGSTTLQYDVDYLQVGTNVIKVRASSQSGISEPTYADVIKRCDCSGCYYEVQNERSIP